VLSQTNQKQSEYYLNIMPTLLGEFQQFEEERLQYMKQMTEKFADVHSEIPTMYTTVSDSISNAARSIVVDSDISAFVAENKTNVTVPQDIPYTPYDSEVPSQPKSRANGSASKPLAPPSKKSKYPYKAATENDTLSSREWGLTQSDRSLSPDEQAKKLNAQIKDLEKGILSETKSKEGLENLVRCYASDPVAQKKAEDEIAQIEVKLQHYQDSKVMVEGQISRLGAPSNAIQVRGLYDYSATCDTELTFREGDILSVSEQDDSGWWYAELNGKAGFVPNNYVELIK